MIFRLLAVVWIFVSLGGAGERVFAGRPNRRSAPWARPRRRTRSQTFRPARGPRPRVAGSQSPTGSQAGISETSDLGSRECGGARRTAFVTSSAEASIARRSGQRPLQFHQREPQPRNELDLTMDIALADERGRKLLPARGSGRGKSSREPDREVAEVGRPYRGRGESSR